MTYDLLAIASFRIGVPSILFLPYSHEQKHVSFSLVEAKRKQMGSKREAKWAPKWDPKCDPNITICI